MKSIFPSYGHLLATICALFFSASLYAQATSEMPSEPFVKQLTPIDKVNLLLSKEVVPTMATDFEFSLAKLLGDNQPVTLTGISRELNFSLPLPALWRPSEITLNLQGTVSRALIETSELVISVNGHVIQQYPLQSANHSLSISTSIPVDQLKPGFNQISLHVIQHYSNICEYPRDPQLWSQINVEQSTIKIVATPTNIAATLNNMNLLFDKANWNDRPSIPVMTAGLPDAAELSAMGLVAQGIGSKFDFVPVSITHGVFPGNISAIGQLIPDNSRVAVVMGTFTSLRSYLEDMHIANTVSPLIAIRPLPNNPNKFLLIMAAGDKDGLKKIATAFALKAVPWPGRASVSIEELKLPEPDDLEKRFDIPLASSGAFPLRALEYTTSTYNGIDSEGPSIRVWNNSWQGRMQVRLHLAYASGMSTQSALNVLTNDVMQGTIPLSNPLGGKYDNYAVTIPAGALKPGWNTLQFKPVLIPISNGGQCQPFFNGNLALTIYEDTTLQKFGGDELREPDLALVSGAGRLYTEEPFGKGIAIQLTDHQSDTLSSGLTLLGKLSQIYKRPLLNSWFGVGIAPGFTHKYWVGSFAQLPQDVKLAIKGTLPSKISLRVPVVQSATIEVLEGNEWFRRMLEALSIKETPPPRYTSVDLSLSGQFDNNTFAATALLNDNVLTVFTAKNAATLKAGVDTLIDYGQWSQLKGRLAFWPTGGKVVNGFSNEDTPFSAYGLRGGLGIWVSQHPWIALFMLLVLISIVVFITKRILSSYQKRNHDE